MATKIIVGLGNPGPKYQWTRHNAGFMVLDRLSAISGIPVTRKKYSGLFGEGSWNNTQLFLLKPQTFMNLSGQSVLTAMRFHNLSVKDLVVIHDDLDVPFGQVRLKDGGGSAGHNGLRSMVSELGDGSFARVRVGIGRPAHGDVVNYVLSDFTKVEFSLLPTVLDNILDLLSTYINEGLSKAMSLYNKRDLLQDK
ncbi:MAG: peptidyl-tRNA hydrolase [Geobacteraceae bacterium]|jgi:PTH1 family peptidyl-tRNA hydrolase|nr:peptidyl-tRNA hydrolase [Geobacteraceae bacterium]